MSALLSYSFRVIIYTVSEKFIPSLNTYAFSKDIYIKKKNNCNGVTKKMLGVIDFK